MKAQSGAPNSFDAALQQRLLAAGCPMPSLTGPESPRDVTIEVSKPEITIAYDMRAGTEYVFGVRITNHSYSRLVLQRFRARLPWVARLYWPGDPRIYTPERKAYRLESGRKFPCNEVLNHRVREHGVLGPGGSSEGVLLAYTMFDRIPFDHPHGTIAPARLFVIDQFGRKHRSEVEILIDRTATMPALASVRRGTGLYGGFRSDEVPTPYNVPAVRVLSAEPKVEENEKKWSACRGKVSQENATPGISCPPLRMERKMSARQPEDGQVP